MNILGIWDGHDSGAALLQDGRLVAAVNEERFTRRKLEVCFPAASIRSCLSIASLAPAQVDVVAISTSDVAKTIARWAPSTKERYYQIRRRKVEPGRLATIAKRAKYWITEWPGNRTVRWLSREALRRELVTVGLGSARLRLVDHHEAHAAAAARTSGFDESLVITLDGVGDGLSATISRYAGGSLARIAVVPARHSLGIFFEHVTNLLNMRELEDEGKVMALADYASAVPDAENPMLRLMHIEGLHIRLSRPARELHADLQRILWRYPNEQFAQMAQRALEQSISQLVASAVRQTGLGRVSLAGGIVSNVKVNRQIRLLPGVEDVYVFPHMGDGGLALGAALAVQEGPKALRLETLALGPEFDEAEMLAALNQCGIRFTRPECAVEEVADLLQDNRVVLWFDGRMEYGPRALGHRSVLARADSPAIRDRLNLLLKRRVWYQPFCPTMLESEARRMLEGWTGRPNRYMTMAYVVADEHRSRLAGVMSVDGSCRPQMIADEAPGRFGALLHVVRERLGTGALLNTSLNIHGEPLVCTPREAVDVYLRSGADALVLGPYLAVRSS